MSWGLKKGCKGPNLREFCFVRSEDQNRFQGPGQIVSIPLKYRSLSLLFIRKDVNPCWIRHQNTELHEVIVIVTTALSDSG